MNDNSNNTQEKIRFINEAALKLSKAGEYRRALDSLQQAIMLDPNSESTYVLLGLTYQSLNEGSIAEEQFRKALSFNPDNLEAMKSLGLYLISQKKQEEGIEWLNKYLLRIKWEDIQSLQTLVSALWKLGRQEESLKLLLEGWEETVKPEIGRLYAQKLDEFGMKDEALWVWKFISIHSKDPDDYFELSMLLWQKGRYEEVIDYLEKAFEYENQVIYVEPETLDDFYLYEYDESWGIEKEPDEEKLGIYKYLISQCYKKLGDEEPADQAINTSQTYLGSGPNLYLVITSILINKQLFEEALDTIDIGISSLNGDENGDENVEEIGLFHQKSDVFIALGNNERAYDILTEAVQKYPSSPYSYLHLFEFLINQNRFEEAYDVIENAQTAGIEVSESILNLPIVFLFIKISNSKIFTVPDKIITNIAGKLNDNHLWVFFLFLTKLIDNDLEFSRTLTNALTGRFPSNPVLHHFSAESFFLEDKLDEAYASLESALKFSQSINQQQYILNNIGYIDLLNGNLEDAERNFLKIINQHQENNNHEYPKFLKIALYKNKSIIPDDINIETRITDPDLAALVNLQTLFIEKKDFDQATAYILQILKELPYDSLGFELLGLLSLAKGEKKAALESLKIARQNAINRDLKQDIDKVIQETELSIIEG